jgi:hypothetical protein
MSLGYHIFDRQLVEGFIRFELLGIAASSLRYVTSKWIVAFDQE